MKIRFVDMHMAALAKISSVLCDILEKLPDNVYLDWLDYLVQIQHDILVALIKEERFGKKELEDILNKVDRMEIEIKQFDGD